MPWLYNGAVSRRDAQAFHAYVDANVFLFVVALGSALVGLWLVARLPWLAPRSLLGAAACFALAWILPGLADQLLDLALARFSVGLAIMLAVFPALTATFALVAAGLIGVFGLNDGARGRATPSPTLPDPSRREMPRGGRDVRSAPPIHSNGRAPEVGDPEDAGRPGR
jgi:hypothetical protein